MRFCLQCEPSFINIINSKSCKVDFWKQPINPVLHLSCQMYSLQKKKKKKGSHPDLQDPTQFPSISSWSL